MNSDAQEMFAILLDKMNAAHELATIIAALATTQRNLLGILAAQPGPGTKERAEAEKLSRKAMDLWDRFWSIDAMAFEPPKTLGDVTTVEPPGTFDPDNCGLYMPEPDEGQ